MRATSFEQALDGPFREAMSDFDATAWRPFLRSLDGKSPQPGEQQALFAQCTGRTEPFNGPPRMAQACCGRRSGEDRGTDRRYRRLLLGSRDLSKGERAKVLLLSQTRDRNLYPSVEADRIGT
jgi:hypothetical protein